MFINSIPKIQDIHERHLQTSEALMKDIYGKP